MHFKGGAGHHALNHTGGGIDLCYWKHCHVATLRQTVPL